jgi:hypothetical protein
MRPQDMMPDGLDHVELDNGLAIRKGTFAAFLTNARIWCDPQAMPAARAAAEQDIIELLPALHAAHTFDVLTVRDPALRKLVTNFRSSNPRVFSPKGEGTP